MAGQQESSSIDAHAIESAEEFDQFDEERIIRGEVSPKEVSDLENKLVEMYLQRARLLGKPIVVITSKAEYERLKASGEFYDKEKFYLVMDEKCEQIADMHPLFCRLLDTDEGRFYAKLVLLCLHSLEHH